MKFDFDNPQRPVESPFKVPDGYFDTLTERVMARIPENEVKLVSKPRSRWATAWRAYAAVAAMVALLFGAGIYFNQQDEETGKPVASATGSYSEEADFDAVADYIMADESDFYAYLSGE